MGVSQNAFQRGDRVVNLGIGIGNTLYPGSGYTSKTPPVSLSFEKGVLDKLLDEKSSLGIGGYIGYSGARWEHAGWGWKYTNFLIGARGVGHYSLAERLDTYTGLMVGYNILKSSEFGVAIANYNYTASSGGFTWAWFAGGRYSLTNRVAAMAEIGYGIAYLNLGISYKF